MTRVLVAGGSGVVGRPLVARLRAAGHEVVVMGRRGPDVVADALDAAAVERALREVRPEVVVNQLTAIPRQMNPIQIERDFAATNLLRTVGTRNLDAAARAVGVRVMVAQSVAFLAEPGPTPATESDPVWEACPAPTLTAALRALEGEVLGAGFARAVVLRYGLFWGPGTVWDVAEGSLVAGIRARKIPIVGGGPARMALIHVDDAARATERAIVDQRWQGVVQVVEAESPSAAEVFGTAAQRLGAKPPRRVPAWLVRLIAGRYPVFMATTMRPASGAKAAALGFEAEHAFLRDFGP